MSAIHWFKKGLRLHDNPALIAALKPLEGEPLTLRPVFVLDPWFLKNGNVGDNRWRFLQQTLVDLDTSLKKLGSRLYVLKGSPEEVFEKYFKKWDVKKITWEIDTEPYAKSRDAKIQKLAEKNGIILETFTSHTMYNPDQIIAKNKGEVPLTYQKLCSLISSIGSPAKPIDAPEEIAKESKISKEEREKTRYSPPSLKDLGLEVAELEPCLFPGGETEALRRLSEKVSMKNASWVRNFEKPQTSPNSLSPSTTVLSPYLKFGCVSPKLFYWRVQEVYQGAKHSQPPVSLHGQLLWREFFYTVAANTPNFDKMEGNRVCRQIPWDEDNEKLQAWKEGRTGYPWIDAIMTQLRKEGWIHHLARHSVACFLTRGDLWQSWEAGQHVFEELLLDADWSLNAGNWMWLSASAFFHQFFRVYSPVAFGKKTDKNGDYIRKYLPILKKFPSNYIYEPWKAPLSVQKAAGCIIGTDYPRPIVDHDVIHKENMAKMKAAYAANKAANGNVEVKPGKKASNEETPKAKKQKKMDSFVKPKNEN